MPDYEVTNGSRLKKGFRANGGIAVLKPNQTEVLRDLQIEPRVKKACEDIGVVFKEVGAEPDELEELRAAYEAQFNKPADKRWKSERILEEMTK